MRGGVNAREMAVGGTLGRLRSYSSDANIEPMDSPPHPRPTLADGWTRKRRYHHGNLAPSALARGRQIVALHGPCALSLRGLARDLGVTATSLVRLFGNLAGMRAAVAESALGLLLVEARVVSGQPVALQQAAGRWVAFAATHANLYRLASGEGWHAPGSARGGLHGMLTVSSPRRALETALGARRDPERAAYLASTIHGLALARIDGLTGPDTERALARALRTPRG